MKNEINPESGFTLIELIVGILFTIIAVITIIGLIALVRLLWAIAFGS